MNITKTKVLAAISVVAVFLSLTVIVVPKPAQADQFDAQIAALKNQIQQNQDAANQKHGEADTLKNKIAQIQAQINAAQAALNLTKVQVAQTNQQIDEANRDLDKQKGIMKNNLKILYKQGEVTPLEVVASSKNLSDFVANQQYLGAIKKKVDDNMNKIAELQKTLAEKKDQLVGLQTQQQAQADNVAAQQAQQQQLLAQTQGDEAKYQSGVADSKKQLEGIYAQRAAYNASNNIGVSTGGTGGYPYANGPIDAPDPWSFLTRECTSYVAWWRRAHNRAPYPYMWGNAGNWPGQYITPTPGAIAVFPPGVGGAGGVGHVAIVEAVHGSTMDISEYNYTPAYQFSRRSNVPMAGVKFIN